MYEVTLISPDGAGQFAQGLDQDVRYVAQLADGRGVLCYGAADAGEVYSIGVRRGGGLRIVGDERVAPYWPCWPHRADAYPDFEAFFWATGNPSYWTLFHELRGDPAVVGMGIGPMASGATDGWPALLVNLGHDDQGELSIAIDRLFALGGPWDGEVVVRSLTAAPAMAR